MSDLFLFLRKANEGDFQYVDRMTDEEVKAIQPYVLLGWGMGAEENNEIHTIMTDLLMNDKVFGFYRHPRLLLKLFIAANCGIDHTRYSYEKSSTSKDTKEIKEIAAYYDCGLREARDYAKILDADDKKQISQIMGEKA